MTTLKSLVEAKLAISRKNPFEAARDGGLERSFVNDILIGKKRSVSGANVGKLAIAIGATSTEILSAMGRLEAEPAAPIAPYVAEPNAVMEGPAMAPWSAPVRDVEELGVGIASIDDDESAFELNGNVVDRVVRPPGLLNRPGVFALRVANLSMWPKFRDGERVYVDSKKPAIEDFIVVELKPTEEDKAGKAYVKMLVGRDAKKIVVEQFNPRGRLEFGHHEIARILRVIPMEELWG
ncbi:S24 family peptidase [Bosea sp. BK604]|uniref:S24 family peptidase n=1 Tax=Bosea sp. BK604 TaxID=2512180 RepID=UPI0010E76FEE|nr:S24 family peptidase [Bosea sp. BK604]TCR69715.1 phage repressor protein C with HTH and peptisase S24 domain [Bosea sp. BK604]